jgi:hypothetical protein
MSDYQYKLNCGQYVLHNGDTPIGAVMDEVAIAFDRENGTLHKHGSFENVQAWVTKSQQRLRESAAGGLGDLAEQMANDLAIISGKFPVEELNRCLSTTGYVLRMVDKLQKGLIGQEPQTLPPPLR